MANLIRRANFYLALFFCSYLASVLAATVIVLTLPTGLVTDSNFFALPLLLSAAFMTAYSIRKGTHRLGLWSNALLIPASRKWALGHIGVIFIGAAVAIMAKAKSGSGVVLAPALIWSVAFYRQGFTLMSLALQPLSETPASGSSTGKSA